MGTSSKIADEARRQLRELKDAGVDGIKGILESGVADQLFNRMDVKFLQAVAQEARVQNLPLVVHTAIHRMLRTRYDRGQRCRTWLLPGPDSATTFWLAWPRRELLTIRPSLCSRRSQAFPGTQMSHSVALWSTGCALEAD